MTSMEQARRLLPYMTALRRHFHKNPELSWQEHETSAFIRGELEALGIAYERVGETGLIATIPGQPGAPVIGLRADMDALPVTEQGEKDYTSCRVGVMHACGHDAHMAILLGTARLLLQNRERLRCAVRLIFQPAEEVIGGAKVMVGHPLLAGLDEVAAVHVWSQLPVGTIAALPGARMASADTVKITIAGKGAHGSMPHLGVDALYIAALIENAVQAVVSRMTNPFDPVVVTMGSLQAGSAPNIIAGSACLEGTLRAFRQEVREQLPRQLEHIVKHMTAAFGADYSFEWTQGTPPLVNHPESCRIAQAAAACVVGPQGVADLPPTTGGEDFAYYLEKTPGMLAFVGCANPEKQACYPHHHDRFDLDENCLANAAAFFLEYVMLAQEGRRSSGNREQ